MKFSKNIFSIVAGILIIISLLRLFEPDAFSFVSEVSQKNLKFLKLVSEVKLVFAGISEVNVPFISGHSGDLTASLDKLQSYLLAINIISFSQLIILSISKTWFLKIFLLALFGFHLFKRTNTLVIKYLILALAISPGLSIYSVTVQYLSAQSSIDFGEAYLKKMETQVLAIKAEKSTLMLQHARQLNQIDNGEKGIKIFKKLKEDVSYDFKDVHEKIHGGFMHIRLLIHEAGHEMLVKTFNFGTMVLFCFLIMPIGYVFLLYVLYKHLFVLSIRLTGQNIGPSANIENDTSTHFMQSIRNVFKAIGAELSILKLRTLMHRKESKVEQIVDEELQQAEHHASSEISEVKEKLEDSEEKNKDEIDPNDKNPPSTPS